MAGFFLGLVIELKLNRKKVGIWQPCSGDLGSAPCTLELFDRAVTRLVPAGFSGVNSSILTGIWGKFDGSEVGIRSLIGTRDANYWKKNGGGKMHCSQSSSGLILRRTSWKRIPPTAKSLHRADAGPFRHRLCFGPSANRASQFLQSRHLPSPRSDRRG